MTTDRHEAIEALVDVIPEHHGALVTSARARLPFPTLVATFTVLCQLPPPLLLLNMKLTQPQVHADVFVCRYIRPIDKMLLVPSRARASPPLLAAGVAKLSLTLTS